MDFNMPNKLGEDTWTSSYVFGFDNESGWNDRYFFTYFSEFGERSASVAAEVTIFLILFLVTVVANVAIMICVLRFSDMRTVTNCFVLNLAAADLLFALTIPEVSFTRISVTWNLGTIACKIVPYVQFVSGVVLLWTLALISMDRYRCIVIPPYRSTITPKQASLLSALIWIMSIIVLLPVAFWFRQQTSIDGKNVCTLVFPKSDTINYALCFVLTVVIFACLLPMGLLVYYYQRIFKKIITTRNTWASSCVVVSTVDIKTCERTQNRRQSELSVSDIFVPWPRKFSGQIGVPPNGRSGSLSQQEELRIHKHIKVVRVLFLNVVVVLIMWLPITVVMLLIFIDGRRPNEDQGYFLRSHHFVASLIVAFLNTLINPLLYGLMSDNFRTCLVRLCCVRKYDDKIGFVKENITPSSGRVFSGQKGRKQSLANSVSENQNGLV